MKKLINPRNEIIYGWEGTKCLENVLSIMIGFVEGDKIPPVKLYSFDDGETFEVKFVKKYNGYQDGGHHRLIAAWLLNRDLKVNIKKLKSFNERKRGNIKIEDIKLVPNPYRYLRNIDKKRRLPPLEEFFPRYKQINDALKEAANYDLTREQYKLMLENVNSDIPERTDKFDDWI